VRIERADGTYRVSIGERTYQVQLQRSTDGALTFLIDGQPHHALVAQDGSQYWVALNAQSYTLTKIEKSARRRTHSPAEHNLTASMPGQVIKLLVSEGELVTHGQALLVLEAMKMEVRVNAPYAGIVSKLLCEVGQIVERGQPLLELMEKKKNKNGVP